MNDLVDSANGVAVAYGAAMLAFATAGGILIAATARRRRRYQPTHTERPFMLPINQEITLTDGGFGTRDAALAWVQAQINTRLDGDAPIKLTVELNSPAGTWSAQVTGQLLPDSR